MTPPITSPTHPDHKEVVLDYRKVTELSVHTEGVKKPAGWPLAWGGGVKLTSRVFRSRKHSGQVIEFCRKNGLNATAEYFLIQERARASVVNQQNKLLFARYHEIAKFVKDLRAANKLGENPLPTELCLRPPLSRRQKKEESYPTQ